MISALAAWRDRRALNRAARIERQALATVEKTRAELEMALLRLASARNQATASGAKVQQGRFSYEANQAWRGARRWDTVDAMLSDAHVEGVLRNVLMPLQQAEWRYEPASDDPRDVDVADFCNANLLRKSSERYGKDYWCQTSWEAQRLPEICAMLQGGFSLFHTTDRIVGNKRVYDRLQWLEPRSVDPSGWNISATDEILGVARTYADPTGVYQVAQEMPAEELVLYPWALIGARFEGRALIRSLYGAWSRKDAFLRASLSYAAKTGDPVPYGYFPPNYSETDKRALAAAIAQMRAEPPPELSLVFPLGSDGEKPEIGYIAAGDNIDRMRTMIDGENAEIAHGGGTKTALLGETSTGSRAVGDSISPLEKMAVKAVANAICELEMHGAGNLRGLMERLVDENFAGVQAYPTLTCKNLDPTEATKHVPALVDAVQKKAIPALPKVAHRILTAYGVDVPLEDVEQAMADEKARADQAAQDRAQALRDAQDQRQDPPAALSSNLDVRRKLGPLLEQVPQGVLPRGALRWPTRLETDTVDLAGIRTAYREGESEILAALRRVQRAMVDELVGRVRNGSLTGRNVNGIRRSKFRARDKMIAAHVDVLIGVAGRGTQHVADELERLQKRASLAKGPKRVGGYRITPAAREELLGQVQTLAEIDLDRIWSRLLDQALPEFARMERRGLAGDDLARAFEDYLTNLSEKPLEDLTREEAGRAYNEGRDAGIQTAAANNAVRYVMRSEVLDDNTCETCRGYDGRIVEVDSDEYVAYMPPAGCEGGPRCRGFYVLIPPEMNP